jgi:xanthine dehydrogenase accessory factor
MTPVLIILRGGGDLASGVALRLHRAGLRLIITELPQPLVVRRLASFAEAVYSGEIEVEGSIARRAENLSHALALIDQDFIPVLVDPAARVIGQLTTNLNSTLVVIDGRMTKRPPEMDWEGRIEARTIRGTVPYESRTFAPEPDTPLTRPYASLIIGLGPGFIAGENCDAVIETNRGSDMGRVIWQGAPETDTGLPEAVANHRAERVLRAPAEGILHTTCEIGDRMEPGQRIADVAGQIVSAPFHGVLRGLLHPGLQVSAGMKIGDVDPRNDPRLCRQVSDKALAVGGGVLEAILSRPELRPFLWASDQ